MSPRRPAAPPLPGGAEIIARPEKRFRMRSANITVVAEAIIATATNGLAVRFPIPAGKESQRARTDIVSTYSRRLNPLGYRLRSTALPNGDGFAVWAEPRESHGNGATRPLYPDLPGGTNHPQQFGRGEPR